MTAFLMINSKCATFYIDHVNLDEFTFKIDNFNYQASESFHVTQNLIYMLLWKILDSMLPLAQPKKYILFSAI